MRIAKPLSVFDKDPTRLPVRLTQAPTHFIRLVYNSAARAVRSRKTLTRLVRTTNSAKQKGWACCIWSIMPIPDRSMD